MKKNSLFKHNVKSTAIIASDLKRTIGAFENQFPMSTLPPCPQCREEYTYEDGKLWMCPSCGHGWSPGEVAIGETAKIWKDAHGKVLQDGDNVTLVKDLKIKGSSAVVKVGTKVKNIRLTEGDHDIDCKIDGFGPMQLKTEFVKKA